MTFFLGKFSASYVLLLLHFIQSVYIPSDNLSKYFPVEPQYLLVSPVHKLLMSFNTSENGTGESQAPFSLREPVKDITEISNLMGHCQ